MSYTWHEGYVPLQSQTEPRTGTVLLQYTITHQISQLLLIPGTCTTIKLVITNCFPSLPLVELNHGYVYAYIECVLKPCIVIIPTEALRSIWKSFNDIVVTTCSVLVSLLVAILPSLA